MKDRTCAVWISGYLATLVVINLAAMLMGIDTDDGLSSWVVTIIAVIVGWKAGNDLVRVYVRRTLAKAKKDDEH